MSRKVVLLILFVILRRLAAHAQVHPVQVTPQLVPPYSVYLADYATPGNDKLRLVVLQRDVTRPFYQVRLQLSIALNGSVVLRTTPSYRPAPITVSSGAPLIVSGTDLQPYLDSRNLDFIGINHDEYERTKTLPEGSYQICITAYDYSRQDVAVSEPGCNFFWLAKDEPPLLNFPACGTALPLQMPQQVIFSWLPRSTASANAANDTEYEFSLYETRPAGRNPNDVVLSAQPIYRTTTPLTQLMYSAAEPLLLENMTYVWRVRAVDKSGKDLFRNNGYSEVCTFTYGTVNSNIQLIAVDGLQAQAEAERRAQTSWTAQQDVEGYKVYYKKSGSTYQWFSKDTPQNALALMDLEPNTDYEVRVLAYVGAAYGPYSDIVKFKTPQKRVAQCGDALPAVTASAAPLAFATQGMIINVQGIDLTLTDVHGPNGGVYAGKGQVTVPYLGASFNVVFTDLFIDENQMASRGRIDFITRKIDDYIDTEVKDQQKEKQEEQQEQNRETWKDTDFYDKVIYYNDDPISDVTVDDSGQITVTTEDGRAIPDPQIAAILKDAPEKAIIIEDKNGEQWVVQKDPTTGETKVTKVDGGGLSPDMNVTVSNDDLELVKEALTSLHTDYTGAVMQKITDAYQNAQKAQDDYIRQLDPEQDATDPEGELAQFLQLSQTFKEAELEYDRGLFIQIAGTDENIPAVSAMIAREIRIDDKTLNEYAQEQKKAGTPDDVRLAKVKESVTNLIDKVMLDLSLKNELQQTQTQP